MMLPRTIGSLFSGIGGLELGVEAATGARTVWQVESDSFCRDVLARHWPNATRYNDVVTAGTHGYELEQVDLICGGFPCQDISFSGRRAGLLNGKRSGLWSEFARIVRVVRPRFVFVENVAAILTVDGGLGFGRVLGDLAEAGYDAEWTVLRASDAGAPHNRSRLFLLAKLADPDEVGPFRFSVEYIDTICISEPAKSWRHAAGRDVGRSRDHRAGEANGRSAGGSSQPGLGRGADGVSSRLDIARHRWPAGRGEAQHGQEPPRTMPPGERQTKGNGRRLMALGNAVVPQQAALAFVELWSRRNR